MQVIFSWLSLFQTNCKQNKPVVNVILHYDFFSSKMLKIDSTGFYVGIVEILDLHDEDSFIFCQFKVIMLHDSLLVFTIDD